MSGIIIPIVDATLEPNPPDGSILLSTDSSGTIVTKSSVGTISSFFVDGTPIKNSVGQVILDPNSQVILDQWGSTVLDWSTCFPFMPNWLSVGSNFYVGGPWDGIGGNTQEAHLAISWDSGRLINVFTGDGSGLINISASGSLPAGSNYQTLILDGSGNPGFSYTLFDDNGHDSVLVKKRVLRDSSTNALDWSSRLLIDASTIHSIDWNNRQLILNNGQTVVDYQNLQLLGGIGQIRYDWNANQIHDNNNVIAIDLNVTNRNLIDNGGAVSVDWQARQLKNGAGYVVVDYSGLYLQDGSNSISMNWNSRTLWDGSHGFPVMNWGSSLLLDVSGNTSADWQNRQLKNSNGITNVDWSKPSDISISTTTIITGNTFSFISATVSSFVVGKSLTGEVNGFDNNLSAFASGLGLSTTASNSHSPIGAYLAVIDNASAKELSYVGALIDLTTGSASSAMIQGCITGATYSGIVVKEEGIYFGSLMGNLTQTPTPYFKLPNNDGSSGYIMSTDGSGNLTYKGSLYDVSGHISVDWSNRHLVDSGGHLIISWNGNSLWIVTPTITIGALLYTFPSIQGASGSVLTNDGSGHLSWTSSSGGGSLPSGSNYQSLILDGSGNPSFSYVLYDGSGVTSSEYANRLLKDENGQIVVDWNGNILTSGNNNQVLNWGSNILIDNSGNVSVNWNSRQLIYGGGQVVVDWDSLLLKDQSNNLSVNWLNRLLIDGSGNTASVSWNQRQLVDSSNNVTLDWDNRNLYNIGGVITVDWHFQQLFDGGHNLTIDWGSRHLVDHLAQTSVDWDNKQLISGVTPSVFWDIRVLADNSNNYSIDWDNRRLHDENGIMLADWNNGYLTDPTENISIDWKSRLLIDSQSNIQISWSVPQTLQINAGTVSINSVPYHWTSVQGGSNTILVNDGSGNLAWSPNKIPHVVDTISDGDTVTLTYNTRTIVDSTTDIGNITFGFFATPSDGDFVAIKMLHAVTVGPSWSTSGTVSISNIIPYTTLSAGQEFTFTYDQSRNLWC